jgi:CheY-like chemotaxis protein
MPKEVQERAFEPFFTTKPVGQGTGLGLSMVYGFVKQSGGHVKIYSEEGHGTSIKIYLPRALQAEAEVSELLAGPIEGGTETILVVEDDADVRNTVVEILADLGYRVLKASDGQGALAILSSGVSVDLLFTDVVMPGPVRCTELSRQARALLPDLEVLFTSGYTEDAIVHGGRLDPGVSLLSKPYRPEDLARKLRHMFRNRQHLLGLQAAAPPKPVQNTALAVGLRVLFVEDNEDLQLLTTEFLRMLGHEAAPFSSAEEALEALETGTFDVLMTDVGLPGMSGLELAAKLSQRYPDMGLILASGYGDGVDLGDLRHKAVVLTKPYTVEAVQRVLAQMERELRPGLVRG